MSVPEGETLYREYFFYDSKRRRVVHDGVMYIVSRVTVWGGVYSRRKDGQETDSNQDKAVESAEV